MKPLVFWISVLVMNVATSFAIPLQAPVIVASHNDHCPRVVQDSQANTALSTTHQAVAMGTITDIFFATGLSIPLLF